MIWALLVWAVVLAVDLWTDVRRYYDRKPVNHARGLLLRIPGLVLACILGGWPFIPFALFGYWVLFNGLYNILTGQKWFRVGETAYLDKLTRKHPWIVWAQYIGLFCSILILIYG